MTAVPLSRARILLIISGGIAAYKSLGVDPAAEGARRDGSRRYDRGSAAIHLPSFGGDAQRAADPRRLVQPDRRGGDRPYRIVAGRRSCRGRAGDREYSRPDGGRPRRRPGDHVAAGDRQARARRPGDERPNVAAPGDPPQSRSPEGRRRPDRRPRIGADGLRRIRSGPDGRACRDRRRRSNRRWRLERRSANRRVARAIRVRSADAMSSSLRGRLTSRSTRSGFSAIDPRGARDMQLRNRRLARAQG